ncbi:hypothetical protein BST63_10525 [Bradyrhizobium canariense]|uniref:Uncharacterized protein n=1 Tax=Bradyrhizobium canariense TaxID=255045 RepID=A0ABX3X703_9BRAD|nr:hypothetical protein [Bradyrhizobium canariense]OSJ16847.1 hypothetical protein BSR47_11735 [Bradyrhizobium canariense]OSJ31072.1 hypothetical protein BST63_10525 [Bradyrhizobium canariense]
MIFRIEPFACQLDRLTEYFSDYREHFSEDDLRTLALALEGALVDVRAIVLHRMNVRVEISEGVSAQVAAKPQRGLLDGIGKPSGDAA